MANRTVSVTLRANLSGAAASVKAFTNTVQEGREQIVKHAQEHRNATRDISDLALGVGGGLAVAFGTAIHRMAEFTTAMSAVEAATRESESGMSALTAAALEAGKSTVYSATEAAHAQEELAKAGLNTAQILGGGLKGALDLAAAGGVEVARAAEVAATALKLFKLEGSQLPHVADLLAAGAGSAQGGVHDLGEALKMSGLVASQFGLSIEETIGSLTAFASAGLLGSDAGTSFKTMLMRLAAPSAEATRLMEQLGIAAYDIDGAFVGIAPLAGQLEKAFGGLSQAERDAAMSIIFGADAIRASNILFREGQEGIAGWVEKVDQAGYAAEVARVRLDNLGGDFEKLMGSVETALITGGMGSEGPMRGLVQGATDLVDVFGNLPPVISGTVVGIVGIGGAAALAVGGLGRMIVSAADTRDALKELEFSGTRTQKGMARFANIGGKIAIGLGALAAVSAAMSQSLGVDMVAATKDLMEFGKSGIVAGEATKLLGANLEEIGYAFNLLNKDTLASVANGVATVIESFTPGADGIAQANERIRGLDAALAAMVQSGNTQAAIDVVNRLAETAAANGVNMHELAAGLPEYQAALAGASTTETHAIGVAEAHSNAMDMLAGSMDNAIDAAGGFKAAFDLLNGAAHATDAALIAANRAVWDLKESLNENGTSLDLNTKAGAENVESIMGLADAAAVAAQAKYDETGSVEQATEVYNGYIDKLRATLEALGLTPEAIQEIIDRYAEMPEFIDTKLTVTPDQDGIDRWRDDVEGTPSSVNTDATVTPDSEALDQWKDDLSGIPSTKSTWVYTYHQSVYMPDTSSLGAFKKRHGRARGGRVPEGGRGPMADDVPMNLSSGEYVVNAASTSVNGPVLERMNAGMSAVDAVGMGQQWIPAGNYPSGQMTPEVRVSFDFSGIGDEMGRAMQKRTRVVAAGNVQLAMGKS